MSPRWVAGWRVALRIARREAWRARGRTALMLAMIMLPVLAVTVTAVVMRTADVSTTEGLDRRLGAADARIQVMDGVAEIAHGIDPDDAFSSVGGEGRATLAEVRAVLGRDVPAAEVGDVEGTVEVPAGVASAGLTELDPTDPLTAGLFDLTDGRWPTSTDEVTVNADLAERGVGIGDRLTLLDRDGEPLADPRVVGLAESANVRSWGQVVGLPGAFAGAAKYEGEDLDQTWLVGGGDVSWAEVRALNAIGASVLSRAVVHDPPPEAEATGYDTGGTDDAMVAVVLLVVAMVLLEVVLLAGPSFAVGARRQGRTIALLAATGGTPRQARQVVLATAVVIGGVAAAAGVALGVVLGAGAVPLAQRWSGSWFGPFDVPWLWLLGVGAFGLVSALLAAAVPAWIASRQDVVPVLAGRRGEGPPSVRSPLLGLLLLGLGVAGALLGARRISGGETVIAASSILAVLGMVLLVPVVVAVAARLGRRLPLPLRYAVRDAARHRSRTTPAVAAVAATVAGVVALGIGISSDEAENAGTYTAALPHGSAMVTVSDPDTGYPDPEADWAAVRAAVAEHLPGSTAEEISGLLDSDHTWREVSVRTAHGTASLESWSSTLGSSMLVADAVPRAVPGLSDADRERADRALAAGGAVGFSDSAVPGDSGTVVVRTWADGADRPERRRAQAPVAVVRPAAGAFTMQAVLSPEAARGLGLEAEPVGLAVAGPVSRAAERDLAAAVRAVADGASVEVERGYQRSDETTVVLLVLAALGGVLMLGGSLTATFLALSDARADLATLSAVGAAPRTRRAVAASYALVVGLLGSVLGAAVGFVPGWAVTFPLTANSWRPAGADLPSHFFDVPWLLVAGVVVGLPLLTAAVVSAVVRSRLPLVARLD